MKSITRREFIKSAVIGSALFATANDEYSQALNISDNHGKMEEFVEIHKKWISTFGISASDYISSIPTQTFTDKAEYKKLISAEFSSGKILEIRGLLLSFTEVAAISTLVEHLDYSENV
ncbi:hypothetical protein Q4575_13220 [Psychrosphaera sp. 1_MG-2023]|uniref:hypothetical protein n=1 Tax=Psychrosphaera sp. 1_MG-2023 TaxID=3062643 RepID=UPI0026E3BC3C|nr:hypothetical protein [Psychrosphaera sp. 1_MG-2023]MDO6720372.1 hypothetical protein [Psychrosphaera sp. 1_MG-2023]